VRMELLVSLDFACCGCGRPVAVTLKCKGAGLSGGAARAVAAVDVPCPSCGADNRVFFQPTGELRKVRPAWRRRPTPSAN
jgi:hypothetical protein